MEKGSIIESFEKKKYLWIYENDDAYEIVDIEEPGYKGFRIIEFAIGHHYMYGAVYSDTRYGLVNDSNKLVTNYDYYSLKRLSNGNISASYTDPEKHRSLFVKGDRFNCLLNEFGQPLFTYYSKGKDGTRETVHRPLENIDAVSSCYWGVALFVRDHKIGVVDYKGKIIIEPLFDDIIIDETNNWLLTIVYNKERKSKTNDFDDFLRQPQHSDSCTTYLFEKTKCWPLSLYKIDSIYYVENQKDNVYYLRNKKNHLQCICILAGETYYSPEYKSLNLIGIFDYKDDLPIVSLHIAQNIEGKFGIISMPTQPSVNLESGELYLENIETICPFEYDYIDNTTVSYNKNIIIVKNGKEGLFSCTQKKKIIECVILQFEIDSFINYSIIPDSLGEGLIGCKEPNNDNKSFYLKYSFFDLDGNKVLDIPLGWRIESGFIDGFARLSKRDTIYNTTAEIDKSGKIDILEEKRNPIEFEEESYDEIDRMNKDAFEDDPGAEWNID